MIKHPDDATVPVIALDEDVRALLLFDNVTALKYDLVDVRLVAFRLTVVSVSVTLAVLKKPLVEVSVVAEIVPLMSDEVVRVSLTETVLKNAPPDVSDVVNVPLSEMIESLTDTVLKKALVDVRDDVKVAWSASTLLLTETELKVACCDVKVVARILPVVRVVSILRLLRVAVPFTKRYVVVSVFPTKALVDVSVPADTVPEINRLVEVNVPTMNALDDVRVPADTVPAKVLVEVPVTTRLVVVSVLSTNALVDVRVPDVNVPDTLRLATVPTPDIYAFDAVTNPP